MNQVINITIAMLAGAFCVLVGVAFYNQHQEQQKLVQAAVSCHNKGGDAVLSYPGQRVLCILPSALQ